MSNKIFIAILGMALALTACEAEIAKSTPSIQIKTATPEITTLPTRQGAPNLAGESIQLFVLCSESSLEDSGSQARVSAFSNFADYVNENGGIFSAEVIVKMLDISTKPEISFSEIESSLPSNEYGFLFLLCDEESEIYFAPILDEFNLVGIGPGLASAQTYIFSQNIFSPNPVPEAHFSFWMNVFETQWEQIKPEGVDSDIRMALLTSKNMDSFLLIPEELGIENFEIVWQLENSEKSNVDIYELIYNLRDANTNAVYLEMSGKFSAEFVNALYALGLAERFFVFGPAFSFETEFEENLFIPSFARSVNFSSAFTWWDAPKSSTAENVYQSYAVTNQEKNGAYLAGLQMIDLLLYALEEALFFDSYENFSATNVLRVLKNIEGIDLILGHSTSMMLSETHTLNQLMAVSFTDDYSTTETISLFMEIPEISISRIED